RANHNREAKPNHIWGPPGTAEIMQHRLRGFLWNLTADAPPVSWLVHDIHGEGVHTSRFELRDAFRTAHSDGVEWPRQVVLDGNGFALEAHLMDHGTISIAYVVREPERVNVDTARLSALGLAPGSWVKRVRGAKAGPEETITITGKSHSVAALQAELLVSTPGESIAYLTDFRMDAAARDYLAERLRGVS